MNKTRVIRFIYFKVLLHLSRYRLTNYFEDEFPRLLRIDDFIAIGINHLALHVHHVIEIERAFSDKVVALLDAFLRRLNRFVKPAMFQLLTFFETEALHDFGHSIGGAEIAHQVVFETDVEPRCARIALARATSAQLPIDPPRFVTLGPDHHQAAQVSYARAELNIGAASGHVC